MFESWNVFCIESGNRSAEPVLSLKHDSGSRQLHVTRAIHFHPVFPIEVTEVEAGTVLETDEFAVEARRLNHRVLAFGKRFSDRLYVTYEQGLGTVVSNLVKMDYSLSRRWSLRAETGTTSGGGLFYRVSWD